MSLKTIINGIDVGRQRADGALPDRAGLVSTEWLGGTQTRTLVGTAAGRKFTIDADYPDALLGSGMAPSPPALLMAALGASFVTSFVIAAATADVRIEYIRVRTARAASDGSGAGEESALGDLELHGDVDADASPAHLEQLVAIAIERSLVAALVKSTIRVHLERTTGEDERPQEVRR